MKIFLDLCIDLDLNKELNWDFILSHWMVFFYMAIVWGKSPRLLKPSDGDCRNFRLNISVVVNDNQSCNLYRAIKISSLAHLFDYLLLDSYWSWVSIWTLLPIYFTLLWCYFSFPTLCEVGVFWPRRPNFVGIKLELAAFDVRRHQSAWIIYAFAWKLNVKIRINLRAW